MRLPCSYFSLKYRPAFNIDRFFKLLRKKFSLWRLSDMAAYTTIWRPCCRIARAKHLKTARSARSCVSRVTAHGSMLARSRGHAFATLQGRLRITNARGHSADTGKEPLACTRRTQRGHTVWTAVNRGQSRSERGHHVSKPFVYACNLTGRGKNTTVGVNKWIL